MASWITHMMIADNLLGRFPRLNKNGFCVGNIAPDCNIENADWTVFTPPREVTHWMNGERKTVADCERFWQERVEGREFGCAEKRSFMLGYYSHLVADANFQVFARDPKRVENMLARIKARPEMASRMEGVPYSYDSVKKAFSKRERLRDVDAIEYEYLQANPQSGYLTVLRRIRAFPDYMEFLPEGAIVRKLGVMAVQPEPAEDAKFVFFSREEYEGFVRKTCEDIVRKFSGRI